jgi:hypothetical protein
MQPEKGVLSKRIPLFVEDQETANKLCGYLEGGYKIDPFLSPMRLDNAVLYILLKPGDDLLKCDPQIVLEEKPEEPKLPELDDIIDFVSVEPSKVPDGVVAQLTKAGWTGVSFAAAKNLIQMKLVKKKEGEAPKP